MSFVVGYLTLIFVALSAERANRKERPAASETAACPARITQFAPPKKKTTYVRPVAADCKPIKF